MLSFFFFFSSSLWRFQNFFSGKCHRKSIPSTLPDFFLLSLQICSFCLALPLPLCAGFSLNIHQELSLSLLACLDFMTTTCWFFLTLPCIETLLGSARLFFSFLTRSRLRAVDFLECSSLIKKKKKTLPLYVLTFAVQTERINTTSADHLNVNDTRWMSLVNNFDIKPWNTAHIWFSAIQKEIQTKFMFSSLEKKNQPNQSEHCRWDLEWMCQFDKCGQRLPWKNCTAWIRSVLLKVALINGTKSEALPSKCREWSRR